jgi:hypothetical protein
MTDDGGSFASEAPRKRRWLRRLFKLAVGLVVLLASAWTITFIIATRDLNRAIAALKERGEPTTFAEAVARNHANAPKENGAEFLLQALGLNDQHGRPLDLAAQAGGDYSARLDRKEAAAVAEVLDAATDVTALVEKAVSLPPGPHTNSDASADLAACLRFPAAQDVRALARSLSYDVRASATARNPRRAFQRLKTLLLLPEQLAGDAFVIPQLVRVAINGVAVSTARAALLDAGFSPNELLQLSDLMLRLERDFKMTPSLINERATAASVFLDSAAIGQSLRDEAERWKQSGLRSKPRSMLDFLWADVVASPLGLPARLRAAAEALSIPNEALALADLPPPWTPEQTKLFNACHDKTGTKKLTLEPNASSSSVLGVTTVAARRARRLLSLTALAYRLKRFEVVNTRLPERLQEVCDPTMPTLPTTWFGNEPIGYTKEGKWFRLEASRSIEPDALMTNRGQRLSWGLLLEVDLGTLGVKETP